MQLQKNSLKAELKYAEKERGHVFKQGKTLGE